MTRPKKTKKNCFVVGNTNQSNGKSSSHYFQFYKWQNS